METTEKEVVHRFYEIINDGSPELLDEVCSPDLKGQPVRAGTWPSSRGPWPASSRRSPT